MPYIHQQGPAMRMTPEFEMSTVFDQSKGLFLQLLKDEGVAQIRRILQSGIFKHPSGALAASIQGYIDGESVVWYSDKEYADVQDKGMLPRVQWELLGKVIPITIYTSGGSMKIFRKATLNAILSGKFHHPGFPGKNFFARGAKAASDKIPQLIQQANATVITLFPKGITL